MPDEVEEHSGSENVDTNNSCNRKRWIACLILLLVNLLNYMDRYTIVGVMDRLKPYFGMNDKDSGMLQTVFIAFYMVFAPLFGYLGDRYNRKMLMLIGISIWIVAVFLSSFCGADHYLLFLLCRGIVGIGEASYSTIAPTILSDLFSGAMRSRVFMMFYFAVPVGSGLGFIAGSHIALATDSWQWGVRFSPIIGILCLVVMILLLDEPVRGACEGARQHEDGGGLWEDVKYLFSVRTYYLVSAATIASFFAIGTMSWWTPPFIGYAYANIHNIKDVPESELAHINLVFGIITCLAGLFGVATGSLVSRAWTDGKSVFKNCASDRADVYICAIAMFLALPFMFFSIYSAEHSVNTSLTLIFLGIMSMCLTWSVNVDILLYVVVAHRRATALAIQTLVAHLFGDATAPYIIGALSDWLREPDVSVAGHFFALQKALYVPTFMLVISGALFLAAAFYVENDRKEALFQMDAADDRQHNNSDDMDSLLIPRDSPEVVEGIVEEPAVVNTQSGSQSGSHSETA